MRNLTSRRDLVAGALFAALLSRPVSAFAMSREAGMQGDDAIPSFESGQYQFRIIQPARMMPSIKLVRLDGKSIDLLSLRGKPVLLNFWATWCAACRTELPILERLHEGVRRTGLQIVAVSTDTTDPEIIQRFLKSLNIRSLPIYRDPYGDIAYADRDNRRKAPFALYGMPITYTITGSGRIVGYMPGAADWTSEAASKLIDYLRHS